MNTKIKQLTLLATAGFTYACGQGKKIVNPSNNSSSNNSCLKQRKTPSVAIHRLPSKTTEAKPNRDANEVKTVYRAG